MAAVTQRRSQRMMVIAVVAALHAVVFWALVRTEDRSAAVPQSTSLDLLYLASKQENVEVTRLLPMRPSAPTARLSVEAPPPVEPSDRAPNRPSLGDESNAIHPFIDWAGELSRAADALTSEAPQVAPRELGAPHLAPAPTVKPPDFPWKRSRTNRLERVTEGTAIHLGEHCVMSVTPLPEFSCTPGKKEARGDLFEHMTDAAQGGEQTGLP